MEKDGNALASSLMVTLELLILMFIGLVCALFTSKIEPVLSS